MKMNKTIKPKKKSVGIVYVILTLLLAMAARPLAAQHTLAFGSDGEIRYDAAAGTATVVVNEAAIITNAYAVVKDGAATLNSKNYTNRTVTFTDINDAFGAGKKMT